MKVYNKVNCGYLDNIIFDYENGKLPIDNLNKDLSLFDGLTWLEQSKIRKYYNLALKDGAMSVNHLKLVYITAEIIKKYINNASWNNRFLTVSTKYF